MVFAFAGFELDSARLELRHGDDLVHLEPKSFELLLFLVKNAERVVSKDELMDHVWPNVFVTEASLSGAVKQVRRALGDDGSTQRFIKTSRGKGFRFLPEVIERTRAQVAAPLSPTVDDTGQEKTRSVGPPAIAVLPFSSLRQHPDHQAIAEAIPAELIAALSRLGALRVIARGSTFRFQSANVDLRELHQQLNANYALSGSVDLSSHQLRVVVELTDTQTETLIWGETYTGTLDDVFAFREEIVQSVATAVEQRVPLNEAGLLGNTPIEALDAWGHYHLGVRHLYRFNNADNTKAEFHFNRALELAPQFGRALAGLSYTAFENYNLWSPTDKEIHLRNAISFAERAVDVDPYDPFCNLVFGRAKWIDQDLDEAIGWMDRSIQINPNYAFAHYNNGKFKAIASQGTDADIHLKSALSLSPLDPHLQSMLSARAVAAFVRGESELAVKYAEQSLRAPNAHLFVCVIAATVFESCGDRPGVEKAKRQIQRLGAGFAEDHFLSLFTLREEEYRTAMNTALKSLNL